MTKGRGQENAKNGLDCCVAVVIGGVKMAIWIDEKFIDN